MKKVLIRLFVVFSLVTSCILVAPFHIVNADTFSISNIVGYNVVSTEIISYSSNNRSNTIEIVFDNVYSGYFKLYFKYVTGNNQSLTWNDYVYVSGSKAYITVLTIDNVMLNTNMTNISVSDVHMQLAYDYEYSYPIESFPMVYYCLNQGFEVTDLYGYGVYSYPLLKTNTSGYISAFQANANSDMFVILWSDRAINTSNATSYLTWSSNYSLVSAEMLAYAPGNRTVKLTFHNNSSSAVRLDLKWAVNDRSWFPIYQWYVQDEYQVSTEFGLLYDLNNAYLNMIYALKPTNDSNEAADNLDDSSQDMQSEFDNMFDYEDDFNDSMNNALDDIDVNFNIGNTFGSKFLASATWVRQQFDSITNNTPFGSILSFSLLLGLALLIIGKAIR